MLDQPHCSNAKGFQFGLASNLLQSLDPTKIFLFHGTFQNCLDQPRKKSSFLPEDIFSLIFSLNKFCSFFVIIFYRDKIFPLQNTKKRKNLFIQIVLPLILEENYLIRLDRKRLFVILNKNNNTESERKWLKNKFKQYGVVNQDFTTLKIRMDEIPVSLAIAQAAKETGWGTSRFALEGNALFGQWTWNGEGITPASADSGATHKIMKFKILQASVRAYQRNLNTHSSYKEFRKARAIQRDNDGKLNSLELVKYLDKYAETGKEYIVVLKKIIEQNSLTDFDRVKLLPSSIKLKKLI